MKEYLILQGLTDSQALEFMQELSVYSGFVQGVICALAFWMIVRMP